MVSVNIEPISLLQFIPAPDLTPPDEEVYQILFLPSILIVLIFLWFVVTLQRRRNELHSFSLYKNYLLYGIITNLLFLVSFLIGIDVSTESYDVSFQINIVRISMIGVFSAMTWYFLTQWRDKFQPIWKDYFFWKMIIIFEHIVLVAAFFEALRHIRLPQ